MAGPNNAGHHVVTDLKRGTMGNYYAVKKCACGATVNWHTLPSGYGEYHCETTGRKCIERPICRKSNIPPPHSP